ncbi:DASH complex subunit SPC19 [Microdochium nivale]|nr:DASH complex subunit SPC19 [Microdochium nivale]
MSTTTQMTSTQSSYSDCVSSLRTSLSFLGNSVDTLGQGVADFPRLTTVLKTVRHYELIPQPALAAAEASLRDEIGPAIAALLERVDNENARIERRVEGLKARADLQAGRLRQEERSGADVGSRYNNSRETNARLDADAKMRARAVRQRKEALKYSVERLELEVLQKERELRKRLDQA